ncbi:MAG TPA: TIGR00282 family metallophosphoesterase [Bacillota bacterium]|nr:TIGR00282 family metallophosphoesterase [Peptococcaceae bacterium MAG4]NLW39143.1 TIGR00282 family metallophosphoesterase [Peptococcaceae bacterium]HQD75099.1 TIGR00282 family metallophosphoesterase [Bacillota bacterium]HUM57656.1 TIGR00282 family metallophosphoesterase [Bacillota bacterium]
MRLLMIGDIVGRPGRRAIKANLSELKREFDLDLIIANGENAAGGNGITKDVAQELFSAGVDVLTMGNHVWNIREAYEYINSEPRIIRPANYPPGTPGIGSSVFETRRKVKVAVINLAGRVFLQSLDCPFRKVDEILPRVKKAAQVVVVDFHAEATSEKIAMGWYLAGRVSAVVGTHTHVQTADERILPGGTAYITDLGMTGPLNSVLGVKKEIVIEKFKTQLPQRFEVASGPYQFNAVIIDIDEYSGEAYAIKRIQNYEE